MVTGFSPKEEISARQGSETTNPPASPANTRKVISIKY